MIQEIILGLLFLGAAIYLIWMLYQQFRPSNGGCAKGCGSCSAVDIKNIEEQIRKAQAH